MSTPDHLPLCGCGTCQQAFDAAMNGIEKLLENQCWHWVMAVVMVQADVMSAVLAGRAEANGPEDDANERALRMHQWLQDNNEACYARLQELIETKGHGASNRSVN